MGGFLFAHAGDVQQLVEAEGLLLCHLAEGGVVEDHIGGHLLLRGQPLAQGIQPGQQLFVGFAQRFGIGCAAAGTGQTLGAGGGALLGLCGLLPPAACSDIRQLEQLPHLGAAVSPK